MSPAVTQLLPLRRGPRRPRELFAPWICTHCRRDAVARVDEIRRTAHTRTVVLHCGACRRPRRETLDALLIARLDRHLA
jgi:hypothetical protein